MPTNKHLAREVDSEGSNLWALASLGSVGVGPVGTALFYLVNRETHRGHRFELWTLGAGKSVLPFSGSIGASDFVNFRTGRAVNFFDFDGSHVTVGETNIGLYSWTTLKFWPSWGTTVEIPDGGLNVPGVGGSHGKVNVMFGHGEPREADLVLRPKPQRFEYHSKKGAKEKASAFRKPGDALFAFDKYHLKPGPETDDTLHKIGKFVAKQ